MKNVWCSRFSPKFRDWKIDNAMQESVPRLIGVFVYWEHNPSRSKALRCRGVGWVIWVKV